MAGRRLAAAALPLPLAHHHQAHLLQHPRARDAQQPGARAVRGRAAGAARVALLHVSPRGGGAPRPGQPRAGAGAGLHLGHLHQITTSRV